MRVPAHQARSVAALTLLPAFLVGCASIRVGYDRQPEPTSAPVSSVAPQPVMGLAGGQLPEELTVESARTLATEMWNRRATARDAKDEGTLRALTVDPQQAAEISRLRGIDCCFTGALSTDVLSNLTVLLPPGDPPGYFIARATGYRTADAATALEYQAVFVRRPDRQWRIAMVTRRFAGDDPTSTVTPEAADLTAAEGRVLLSDFGDNLESWFVSGAATNTHGWNEQVNAEGQGFHDYAEAVRKDGYATLSEKFGAPPASRVWVVRTPEGVDIVCGVIPVESKRTAPPGKLMTQPQSRGNWGAYVPPGRYPSFTESSPFFACLTTPDGGEHVGLIGQDRWVVSATVQR